MTLLERAVVACFLRFGGQICLLKRSQSVGSAAGRWHCLTGYLNAGVPALAQALTEIAEETGFEADSVTLVAAPQPLRIERPSQGWVWVIHPFLFDVPSPTLRLDWEHDEYRWIDPAKLATSDVVPWAIDVWGALTR